MTKRRRAYEAGWGTIASGLLHDGMEVGQLTPKAKDEIREALEMVLRLSEERDLRLAAALRELEKGGQEIDRLKALLHAHGEQAPSSKE